MADVWIVVLSLFIVLIVWIIFIIWLDTYFAQRSRKREALDTFECVIYDMRSRPEKVLDQFILHVSLREETSKAALEELKKRDIYQQNTDVRDLVSFEELGGETAGHEFDVLPEALRRVRFEVRPFVKLRKER